MVPVWAKKVILRSLRVTKATACLCKGSLGKAWSLQATAEPLKTAPVNINSLKLAFEPKLKQD